MEFKPENVYYALNATEDLIGAKGYFADDLAELESYVNCARYYHTLTSVNKYAFRNGADEHAYNFFYLVEPAPEKYAVVKFNDYSVGLKKELSEEGKKHILKEGTEEECEQWIEEHSKPKYRPFRNCDELISYFCRKYSILKTDWGMPVIWVKNKNHSEKYLIIAVTENCVVLYVNGQVFDMQKLFDSYTFLDGSVCGVEE